MQKEKFVQMMEKRNKGNDHSPCLDAQEAIHILTEHFMGDNYYIESPVCNIQANYFIVCDILSAYPRKRYHLKKRIKKAIKVLMNK